VKPTSGVLVSREEERGRAAERTGRIENHSDLFSTNPSVSSFPSKPVQKTHQLVEHIAEKGVDGGVVASALGDLCEMNRKKVNFARMRLTKDRGAPSAARKIASLKLSFHSSDLDHGNFARENGQ
jgi:hypothetical protein